MTFSQCSKCGQAEFRIESIVPAGSEKTITTVICSACYSIMGTIDSNTKSYELAEVKSQINQMENKIEVIYQSMEKLANGMQLIYKKLENSK